MDELLDLSSVLCFLSCSTNFALWSLFVFNSVRPAEFLEFCQNFCFFQDFP